MKKHLLGILSAILIINLFLLCSCSSADNSTKPTATPTSTQAPTKAQPVESTAISENGDIEVTFDSYVYTLDQTATATITNLNKKRTYIFGEDLQLMVFDEQKGEFTTLIEDSVHDDLLNVISPRVSSTLSFVTSEKFPDFTPQSDKIYAVAITFYNEENESQQVLVQLSFK